MSNISNRTPEQVVDALRATAEFCRDPNAPKCTGNYAETKDHRAFLDGKRVTPTSPEATSWCAMGFLCYQLGVDEYTLIGSYAGVRFPSYTAIYSLFDRKAGVRNGWLRKKTAHQEAMEPVARLFEFTADRIEKETRA